MKQFVRTWNRSVQPRKQRKFRIHAPLNIRRKFLSAHLSKDLRKKHGKRSLVLRKGDSVKILRGQFKKKSGKVDNVDMGKSKIYVSGMEISKKDGTKRLFPIEPSNVMITELSDDKKRFKRGKQHVKTP